MTNSVSNLAFIFLEGQPAWMLFIWVIPLFFTQTKGGGQGTQQACLIPFAKIRETLCPRLGTGNVLSGGGKLGEKQRLNVGGVTDSCLACSTH